MIDSWAWGMAARTLRRAAISKVRSIIRSTGEFQCGVASTRSTARSSTSSSESLALLGLHGLHRFGRSWDRCDAEGFLHQLLGGLFDLGLVLLLERLFLVFGHLRLELIGALLELLALLGQLFELRNRGLRARFVLDGRERGGHVVHHPEHVLHDAVGG